MCKLQQLHVVPPHRGGSVLAALGLTPLSGCIKPYLHEYPHLAAAAAAALQQVGVWGARACALEPSIILCD